MYKVLFKNYYDVVKLLLRDKVVIELFQLILSQASLSKCVCFLAKLQAGACNFTRNEFFIGDFEVFS